MWKEVAASVAIPVATSNTVPRRVGVSGHSATALSYSGGSVGGRSADVSSALTFFGNSGGGLLHSLSLKIVLTRSMREFLPQSAQYPEQDTLCENLLERPTRHKITHHLDIGINLDSSDGGDQSGVMRVGHVAGATGPVCVRVSVAKTCSRLLAQQCLLHLPLFVWHDNLFQCHQAGGG